MKIPVGILAAILCTLVPAANATPILFTTTLTGANESPPNGSTGSGAAMVAFDTAAHTLHVVMTYSALTTGVVAGHIHCCTAIPDTGTVGVAVPFTGFVTGGMSGSYDMVFDTLLSATYSAAFLAASGGTAAMAELALKTGLIASEAYTNLHTATFPGGEIRGFLHPLVADNFPEPATLALLGAGLLGAFGARRRMKKA